MVDVHTMTTEQTAAGRWVVPAHAFEEAFGVRQGLAELLAPLGWHRRKQVAVYGRSLTVYVRHPDASRHAICAEAEAWVSQMLRARPHHPFWDHRYA